MNTETTININGKKVTMRYCAAAETGFERMTGRSSAIFVPTVEKDADGNVVNVIPAEAGLTDYLYLALAAIVAHYARDGKDAPVDDSYLLYEATPAEIKLLTVTVMQLRNEWYQVPSVIKNEEPTQDDKKNAQPKNA